MNQPAPRPPAKPLQKALSEAGAEHPVVRMSKAAVIDPAQREAMIREAAYFHAERRGFAPGNELVDWLVAEREIDGLLAPRAARSSGAGGGSVSTVRSAAHD